MITSISILLATIFTLASSIKIFAWQKMIFEKQLEFFISYGLNRSMMMIIGFIELSGAATIYFQDSWLGIYGATAIFFTSLGAIGFHLWFDTWKDAIPAFITLSLSGVILVNSMDRILGLMIQLFT